MSVLRTHLTWNNGYEDIEIELAYEENKYLEGRAHLEIRTIEPKGAPLPITETGYRSAYPCMTFIENYYGGDIVSYVQSELNIEAQTKHWKTTLEKSRQLSLF